MKRYSFIIFALGLMCAFDAHSQSPVVTNVAISNNQCFDPANPPEITYDVMTNGVVFDNGGHWFGHTASVPQSMSTYGFAPSNSGIIYAGQLNPGDPWIGNDGYTKVNLSNSVQNFPVSLSGAQIQFTCPSPASGAPILMTTINLSYIISGIKVLLYDIPAVEGICSGQSITLHYDISGYPGPYTILFEKSTGSNIWSQISNTPNMPASGTFVVLPSDYVPGDNYYRLTVTSPANSCSRKSPVYNLKVSDMHAANHLFRSCIGPGQNPVPLDIAISGGVAPYTYNWSPATGLSATNIATPSYTGVTPGNHQYNVTVTDHIGCQVTEVVTVNADNQTFVHSDAVATPNPVCQGGAVTLSGTYAGGVAPVSYAWKNSAGTVLNTLGQQSITQTVTSPATYTLTLTDLQNCRVSDNVTVAIDPALGPQIAPMTIAPVCPGKEVTITPVVTSSAAIASHQWNPGANTTPTITDNAHASVTYSYTVTDVNNCFRSATFSIPRDPGLSGTINLTPTQPPICYNSPVTVEATITGGTPPFSSGSNPYTITTTVPVVYTSVTDAEGCFSEANLTVTYPTPITITRDHPWNPNVSPDVDWGTGPSSNSSSQTNTNICPGELFDFGSLYVSNGGLVSGGVAPYTYHWYAVVFYFPEGSSSNQQKLLVDLNATSFPDFQFQTYEDNNMYPFLPPNSRLNWIYLYVDVIDANGCAIDPYSPVDGIIEHGYRVHSLLFRAGAAALNFNFEQEVCNSKRRGCISFDPDVFYNINSQGYEMKVTNIASGNVFELPGGGISECIDFSETGYHTIEVTTNSICGSISYSKVVYVANIANELEQQIIICNPQSHNLYAQQYIKSDQSCTPYIAMPAEGSDVEFVAGLYIDMNPGFSSDVKPDFTARIDNCLQKMPVKKSSKMMAEQTALDETAHSGFKASIAPNPNNGVFMVEIPDRDFSLHSTRIEVYDLVGRKVYTTQVSSAANSIDLSNFNKGMYVVKITSGSKTVVQKVLYR